MAWTKLPLIRSTASEFYDNLYFHTSWTFVLHDFITRSDLGPQSRLGRDLADHKNGRKVTVQWPDTANTDPIVDKNEDKKTM